MTDTFNLMTSEAIPPFAKHLLSYIGGIEAPSGYDTVYGNNQSKLPKPVTQMTIAEIQLAQSDWSRRFGSSATGRYQFMRETLRDLIKELGLDRQQLFSADLQDRLALHLLKRRGYGRFVAGKIGVTAFARALAQEWASLPVLAPTQGQKRRLARGQSFYAGDGLNKALVAADEFERVLKTSLPGVVGAPVPAPSIDKTPAPVRVTPPGFWVTLWKILRGKDAPVETTAERDRPGMAANGDPALYDQQLALSNKGYTEVGQPDGLLGGRTITAIRAFRAEQGLPASDTIDARLIAALASAGPRQVARERAEAQASDLRQKGNTQIATLDSLGWLGKLLMGGGVLGGVEQSGILNKASDTLQTAQDTLGTVGTVFTTIINVATWCFAHWWLFALLGGAYVIFKAAMGVMQLVVLFRQGFLARADR